jgi:transposase
VSVHQILENYPAEVFEKLGISETPGERSFYRNLERVGRNYVVIHEKFQSLMKKHNLITEEQVVDFSSTYFEGEKAEMGMLGYSRDHRPGKKQINFGISTGMNNIPSALTIQKGNVQDKKHMKHMLKILPKVLEEDSLLIFDCGANTKNNKKKIRKLGFHYLTLKPKKKRVYKRYVQMFFQAEGEGNIFVTEINGNTYQCVKVREEDVKYIFFSETLKKNQLKKKEKKFLKALENNDKMLKKVKRGKPVKILPSSEGWIDLKGSIQHTVDDIPNPYITGIEGFFILESSVDEDPEKILCLYKNKDKAEKFVRDLK